MSPLTLSLGDESGVREEVLRERGRLSSQCSIRPSSVVTKTDGCGWELLPIAVVGVADEEDIQGEPEDSEEEGEDESGNDMKGGKHATTKGK